jgi:predicted dithiol-disulfide oxidoreductase (DUF899 family)
MSDRSKSKTNRHNVVSEKTWLAQRKELLKKEKVFTRQRDALSRQRRALPWVKVEKTYLFDTPVGKKTLTELFDGHSQLIIYHFMFGPGPKWKQGCSSCSFLADHIDGANLHLPHRDVTLLVVSRAPLSKIMPFKKRMDWRFKWVSSFGNDFNFDYYVSFTRQEIAKGKIFYNYEMMEGGQEQPGISVFYKDKSGDVFHTYSSYGRGGDLLIGTYNYLDLAPLGRREAKGHGMDWVRHHDRYHDGNPFRIQRGFMRLDRFRDFNQKVHHLSRQRTNS